MEEMDYKKLYLEQKVRSSKIELDLLQMRFMQVQQESQEVTEELEKYMEELKKAEELKEVK